MNSDHGSRAGRRGAGRAPTLVVVRSPPASAHWDEVGAVDIRDRKSRQIWVQGRDLLEPTESFSSNAENVACVAELAVADPQSF